ncbi:MAG: hypothetical protein ACPLRN_02230 [Microgenomates group bacterium]
MKNNVFSYILVGVISLGIGFYGGSLYQKSQQQERFSQNIRQGQSQQRFNTGTRPISGQIIKKDADSITVKVQDGSSKIVFLSEKTNIGKTSKATVDDLRENENVFVVGVQNQDGSITAQNIQIGQVSFRLRGN